MESVKPRSRQKPRKTKIKEKQEQDSEIEENNLLPEAKANDEEEQDGEIKDNDFLPDKSNPVPSCPEFELSFETNSTLIKEHKLVHINFCTSALEESSLDKIEEPPEDVHEENAVYNKTLHQDICPSETAEKSEEASQCLSVSNDVIQVTNLDLSKEYDSSILSTKNYMKTGVKHLYPSLKNIDSEVAFYESLIKAQKGTFLTKACSLAGSELSEFHKSISNLGNHEFYDLIFQYKSSCQKLTNVQDKINSLRFSFKTLDLQLWKEETKEAVIKKNCGDGILVEASEKYLIRTLNNDVEKKILDNLRALEEALPEHAFEEYHTRFLKSKINLYLYFLHDYCKNNESGVQPLTNTIYPSFSASSSRMELLKTCISILFHFQRMPTLDTGFVVTTRKWLVNLASVVYFIGSHSDRMFVLNHILRCPSDINTWASNLIQLPPDCNISFKDKDSTNSGFQYALASLLVLLSPVPERDEFLKHIKPCPYHDHACPPECNFMVIDSSGQEIKTLIFERDWNEKDILALFQQIPLLHILKNVTNLVLKDEKTSATVDELKMQKLIAFSTFLLDLLGSGFSTFPKKSFESVAKTLGQFICTTVTYLSNYWKDFKQSNPDYNYCLQVEIDRVIFHTVFIILHSKTSQVLLYLNEIPYDGASTKMLWNLLWLFHAAPASEEEELFAMKDIEIKLKDHSMRSLLQTNLQSCEESDFLHILKTLRKLALSPKSEKEYIHCTALELFETFCGNMTRFPKEQLSIISSLAIQQPSVVSFLLKNLDGATDEVLACALKLFEVLDLTNWVPQTDDMNTISTWLLSGFLSTLQNQLSRSILKQLNWNFKGDKLALPIQIHRQVALLIVKAYLQYEEKEKNWSVSNGIKQFLQLCTSQILGCDQRFFSFAWPLLFSLKLHTLNYPKPSWIKIYDGYIDDVEHPNVHTEPWLNELLLAYKEQHPAACYVVMAMTKTGHCLKYLAEEGLEIFSTLVKQKQFAAAVQTLYFMLPFFVKSEELLLTENFLTSLANLITVDRVPFLDGKAAEGTVLSKIQDMIKIQLFDAGKFQIEYVSPILKLWISLLVKLLVMIHKGHLANASSATKQVYFLLDLLFKIAFIHPYTRFSTVDLMTNLTKPLMYKLEQKKQPFWRSTDIVLSPLLPLSASSFSWYAWAVIVSEGEQKIIQDMWQNVCTVMATDNTMAVEIAFKKFFDVHRDKGFSVSIHNLPIYRWLLQAQKMDFSHPLLPLMWQQFFIFYFHRTSLSGLQGEFSMGPRFFEKGEFKAMLNESCLRLKATVDFYQVEETKLLQITTDKKQDIKTSHNAYQKVKNLLSIFRAFHTWLNDEKLHKSVCFPALQPHYKSEKLSRIFQKDTNLWLEYLDLEELKNEAFPKPSLWIPVDHLESPITNNTREDAITVPKEILPPPLTKELEIPTPILNINLLSISKNELKLIFDKFQDTVCNEAVKFQKKLLKLQTLNQSFVKLMPEEFYLKAEKVNKTKACRYGNKCTGPIYVTLEIQKVIVNEGVQNHIRINRTSFDNLLSELIRPPVENVCNAAVHMEIILKKVVQEIKTSKRSDSIHLRNQGIMLFYNQIDKIQKAFSSDVGIYCPTNQFFTTSIEILGKELIEGRDDQVLPLLEKLLANPLASQLVSPYFMPSGLPEVMYISVYNCLVNSISSHPAADIFVLLSKMKLTKWITKNRASYECRKKLLGLIRSALSICGTNVTESVDDKAILYDLVKRDFRGIISYEYPQLFFEAVETALYVSESGAASIEIWEMLFKCMGCNLNMSEQKIEAIEAIVSKFALDRMLTPDQLLYISSPPLSLDHVIHALKYFHLFFSRTPKNSTESLYIKFKNCLKGVTLFLSIMGHCLLELLNTASNRFVPKEERSKTSYLWSLLHSSFQPWIDPATKNSQNDPSFPWPSSEESNAHFVFQLFSLCIEFHQVNFKDKSSDVSILSYTLAYYEKTYVRQNIRDYSVGVCHSSFKNLPWESFHPSIDDVETMYKILQSDISECREFIIGIIMTIPWNEVVNSFWLTKSQEFMSQLLGYLAKIFVKCGWEFCTAQKNHHRNLTKELEKLSWDCVTPDTVAEILGIYGHYCRPLNLLQSSSTENDSELYLLNFLKVLSGFLPRADMPESISNYPPENLRQKRRLYIQKVMELYGMCLTNESNVNKSTVSGITAVVPNHLRDIESIVTKDFLLRDQLSEATPLVQDVLHFCDIVQLDTVRPKILESTLAWFQSKTTSLLLCPTIRSACLIIKHVPTTVAIVETCITSLFKTELQRPAEAMEIWNMVASCFQIPVNVHDEFIESCILQGACFSLYEYVLQRMSWTNTNPDKVLLFNQLISWLDKIDICKTNEDKVLLLWDKVLDLAFSLLNEDDMHVVQSGLVKFTNHIRPINKDKGILSYLGLKSIPFSVNFSFICSAMIAYILAQIPDEGSLRLEPGASGHISSDRKQKNQSHGFNPQPQPSALALKAVEDLKGLLNRSAYAALKIQIERVANNISDPRYCLMESRTVLKELALQVFPNSCFLHLLNS